MGPGARDARSPMPSPRLYLRMEQSVRQEQTSAARGQWLAGEIRRAAPQGSRTPRPRPRSFAPIPICWSAPTTQRSATSSSANSTRKSSPRGARGRTPRPRAKIHPRHAAQGQIDRSLRHRQFRAGAPPVRAARHVCAPNSRNSLPTLLDERIPASRGSRPRSATSTSRSRAEAEKLVRTLENEARIAGARVDALQRQSRHGQAAGRLDQ